MHKTIVKIATVLSLFIVSPFFAVNIVKADDNTNQSILVSVGTVVQINSVNDGSSIYLIQEQTTGVIYVYQNVGFSLQVGDKVNFVKPCQGKIIIGDVIRK